MAPCSNVPESVLLAEGRSAAEAVAALARLATSELRCMIAGWRGLPNKARRGGGGGEQGRAVDLFSHFPSFFAVFPYVTISGDKPGVQIVL